VLDKEEKTKGAVPEKQLESIKWDFNYPKGAEE
jgi:hypothetical protein